MVFGKSKKSVNDRRSINTSQSSELGNANLPPLHPASSTQNLGIINSTSLGGACNILRTRASLGPGDKAGYRRPTSFADTQNSTTGPSVPSTGGVNFQTLPSANRIKMKSNSLRAILDEGEISLSSPNKSHADLAVDGIGSPKSETDGKFGSRKFSDVFKQTPAGHYLGRTFKDDTEDDLFAEEISDLSARFESASSVLSNAALCSVLINYLIVHNRDISPTLFYLVAKHYSFVTTHTKEMAKEHHRFLIEIFTTFLHEKSPLPVKIDESIIQKMEDANSCNLFDESCTSVLEQVQMELEKLIKDIRHGLDIWRPRDGFDSKTKNSREKEFSMFETTLTPYISELQKIIVGGGSGPSYSNNYPFSPNQSCNTWIASRSKSTGIPPEHIALALSHSLVSAYKYFSATCCSGLSPVSSQIDMASGSLSTPMVEGFPSSKLAMFTRSFENLATSSAQTTGSGSPNSVFSHLDSVSSNPANSGLLNWQKMSSFNSKLKMKSLTLFSSFKPRHSQKGHYFQERSFERVVECDVCGGLLWGLAPQGLACQYCEVFVHSKCKSGIKETCSKENKGKRSSNTSTTFSGSSMSLNIGSSRLSSHTSGIIPQLNPGQEHPQLPAESFTIPNLDDEKIMTASTDELSHRRNCSLSELSNIASENYSNFDTPTLCDTPFSPSGLKPQDRPGSIGYSQSISYRDPRPFTLTSPEATVRYVKHIRKKFENTFSGSDSSQQKLSANSTLSLHTLSDYDYKRTSSAMDNLSELVPNDWSEDPEMTPLESFDATVELRLHFPDYEIPTKGPRVQDYVRTLVLLEFHQKVRYMVRYLKQYDYLLIRPWPNEHRRLARVLCLDRIPQLINLFRSLVSAIESTVLPQGYGEMAQAVLNWLSIDDESNLKAWARNCQAVSCTNMLDCVKAFVRDYARKNPTILPLLEKRFNKFVLIEGLTQMRVLYFNLPMIASNIMKDLDKKTSIYKEESKIWQQIYAKLSSLPTSIDKVCIPLVKMINNGQFISTIDKKEQLTRYKAQGGNIPFSSLLLEFPRTLFHFSVIDHAEVTVVKCTYTSEQKVNYDYLREKTDVLAILLDNVLMLLVKEGDRFNLRPFKPTKEQGNGGSTGSTSENAVSPQNSLSITGAAVSSMANMQSTTATSIAGSNLPERLPTNTFGNTSKLPPVFPTASIFTSLGENIDNEYILNMIFIQQAVLLRVYFLKKDVRERWYKKLKDREEKSKQYASKSETSAEFGYTSTAAADEDYSHSRDNSGDLDSVDLDPEIVSMVNSEHSDLNANYEAETNSASMKLKFNEISEKVSELEQGINDLMKSFDENANQVTLSAQKMSANSESVCEKQLLNSQLVLTSKWLKCLLKRAGRILLSENETHYNLKAIGNPILAKELSKHTRSKSENNQHNLQITIASENNRQHRQRSSSTISKIYDPQKMDDTFSSGSCTPLSKNNGLSSNIQKDELEDLCDIEKLAEQIASSARMIISTKMGEESEDGTQSGTEEREIIFEVKTRKFKEMGELFSDDVVAEDSESVSLINDSVNDVGVVTEESGVTELQFIAQEICDSILESIGLCDLHESDETVEDVAKEITDSVVNSALNYFCIPIAKNYKISDSGIEFANNDFLQDDEEDDITVVASTPSVSQITEKISPDSTNCENSLEIKLPETDTSHSSELDNLLDLSISVGRNDSQKSTTSSGYLGSGDEQVNNK